MAGVEGENGCVIVKGRHNDEDNAYEPQNEVELKRLGEFAHRGEAALIKGGLRSASCYACGRIEMLALTRRKWKSLLKEGVLNDQMTQDLSQKAAEYSKEAEARKDTSLEGKTDFDLDAMDENLGSDNGVGEEVPFDLTGEGGEGDADEMTFDLTGEGGEDSDDGVINI